MPGGDQTAVQASERSVVHGKLHLNGRRINGHEGQGFPVCRIRNGFADEHVIESRQPNHVSGMGLGDFDALEALEVKNSGDFREALPPIAVDAHGRIAHHDLAAVNFPESDPAQIIRIIQVRRQQPESFPGVGARRRDVFNDRIE